MKKATAVLTGDIKQNSLPGFHTVSFPGEVRAFVSKIIRQRIRLVESSASMKNEMMMRQLIDKYTPYRSYKFNEMGAATFIIKHSQFLRMLIVDRQRKTLLQLEELIDQAHNIVSPKLF